MKERKKILVVQDNPDVEKNIRAFFTMVFDCEFETKETFVKAYETLVKKENVFDIVVIPDMILGFKDGGIGQNLIPLIRESSSSKAKIYLFASDKYYLSKDKKGDIQHCLHRNILEKKAFVLKISGKPLVFIPKALKVLSI